MMQQNPPTPFEINTLGAYQMLTQLRMRTTILNEPVTNCIGKCLDLNELMDNTRKNQSTMQKLKEDEKEKKCLEFCSLKWEELQRRVSTHLTRREVTSVQMDLMNKMMLEAQGRSVKK